MTDQNEPNGMRSTTSWFKQAWHRLIRLEARRTRRRAERAARDQRITREIADQKGPVVQEGPFEGLRYTFLEAEGSALAPKLLGTYECEVHSWIERLVHRDYQRVVVIGCAEGYYAVGLARRLTQARVFAFDTSDRARTLCSELADANGVADRIDVRGLCSRDDLAALVTPDTLVVCDCEGCEFDLLQPSEARALRHADYLVEVHDVPSGDDPVAAMKERFEGSHHVETVSYGACPREIGHLEVDLSADDRRFAIDENRSRGLVWSLMERR